AFAGLVTAAGGPLVLAEIVRQRGLTLQAQLFESWSGPPTRRLLSLGDPTDSPHLRDQRRAQIERIAQVSLPSAKDETADPQAAAAVIDGAVTALREHTRDSARFPLVFAENRNYGFERNMLAVRRIALAIAIASGSV